MPQYVFRVPEDSDEQKSLDDLLSGLTKFFSLVTYQAMVVVVDPDDRKVAGILGEMTNLVVQERQAPARKGGRPAKASNKAGKENRGRPAKADYPDERPCLICKTPTNKPSGCCSQDCYNVEYARKRRKTPPVATATRIDPEGLDKLPQ